MPPAILMLKSGVFTLAVNTMYTLLNGPYIYRTVPDNTFSHFRFLNHLTNKNLRKAAPWATTGGLCGTPVARITRGSRV